MATDIQLLKAYGHLPDVYLSDLDDDSVALGLHPDAVDVLSDRGCGHPDLFDEEIADSDPSELSSWLDLPETTCDGLVSAHQRMMGAALGQSWPKGCVDEFPGNYAVRYFLDRDTFPEHYTRMVTSSELAQIVEAGVWGMTLEQVQDIYGGLPMLDVAAKLCDIAYRRVGMIQIPVESDVEHNIHIKATVQPGSQIGVAWFNNGTCADHVNNHLDSTYRPGLMGTAKLLCHEQGHNHNCQHTFAGQSRHHGVMSYDPPRLFYGWSTGELPYPLPRDPSFPHLTAAYGGEPVTRPGEPEPPEPEQPAEMVGQFSDGGRDYVITRLGSGSGVIWR